MAGEFLATARPPAQNLMQFFLRRTCVNSVSRYLSPSLHRRFSDLRRHLGAIAGSVGNDCDWCNNLEV